MANHTTLDVFLIHRGILWDLNVKYGINGSDLEVLNAIRYVTHEKGLECSVSCLKAYITGHALYACMTIARKLINLGYIENNGKTGHNRRFYLSLTDLGLEVCRFLTKSVDKRVKYIEEIREVSENIYVRVKKKKEGPAGSARVLPPMDEGINE